MYMHSKNQDFLRKFLKFHLKGNWQWIFQTNVKDAFKDAVN